MEHAVEWIAGQSDIGKTGLGPESKKSLGQMHQMLCLLSNIIKDMLQTATLTFSRDPDGAQNIYAISARSNAHLYARNGSLHRLNAPALEIDGIVQVWAQNSEIHRLDGPAMIFSGRAQFWMKHGKFHRLDGPAIESCHFKEGMTPTGMLKSCPPDKVIHYPLVHKEWYLDGVCTRVDGPAKVCNTCPNEWLLAGKKHRLDGPAEERKNGDKLWFINGEMTRLNNPAGEFANGTKAWYNRGKRHRDGGPALEGADGTLMYFKEGVLHREDGPAVIGKDRSEWWIDGEPLIQRRKIVPEDPSKLT